MSATAAPNNQDNNKTARNESCQHKNAWMSCNRQSFSVSKSKDKMNDIKYIVKIRNVNSYEVFWIALKATV